MPERLRNAKGVARAYNLADALLGYPPSPVCQSYLFVDRMS